MYYSNLYVRHIFEEEMKGDTSFQEKDNILSKIFHPTRYSDRDMRETWDKGIMLGIEIGLRRASLEGQRIELERNICTEREKGDIQEGGGRKGRVIEPICRRHAGRGRS